MNKLFIALDGDNTGGQVGQAVLMDDIEKLHTISKQIDAGLAAAKSWVLQRGGTMISAGGDEMTAFLDPRFNAELESLRQAFSSVSGGLTCTVGAGLTLSQAGKSLLAGKLSGKDQVMPYSHDVEAVLQHAHEADDSAEAHKINEHYLDQTMGDDGWDQPEAAGGDQGSEWDDHGAEAAPDMSEQSHNAAQDQGAVDEMSQPEPGLDDGDAMPPEADGGTMPEQVDGDASDEDQTQSHVDAILGGGEQAPGAAGEQPVDLPENPGFVDANAEEQETADADKAGDPNAAPMGDEQPQDDEFGALQQMLETSASPDEARQRVAEVLERFKQNKEIIEQMREASPEAYESVIAMLQSMIEMARELGGAQQQEPSPDIADTGVASAQPPEGDALPKA